MLIIGSNGNIGRRYVNICKYLHIPHTAVDIKSNSEEDICVEIEKNEFILLCTPTDTHYEMIEKIIKIKKYKNTKTYLLCEKPITKNKVELEKLLFDTVNSKITLFMVNNYNFIEIEPESNGIIKIFKKIMNDFTTEYNYFHSGTDGMIWDCIQLVYLAKGKIILKQESPIWHCKINGVKISREQVDYSYIAMIIDFVTKREKMWTLSDIIKSHQKVMELI